MRKLIASTNLMLIVFSTAAAADDLTLRQRTNAGFESTEYWSGAKRARDLGDTRIIVDLETDTITTIDKDAKSYSVKKIPGGALLAPLTATGNGKPATPKPATVAVKPTGKTETIAGVEAKEYAFESESTKGSIWVADVQGIDTVGQARAMARTSEGATSIEVLARALEQTPGIALRISLSRPTGELISATDVTEVQRTIPADAFTIPPDYKKVDEPQPPPVS